MKLLTVEQLYELVQMIENYRFEQKVDRIDISVLLQLLKQCTEDTDNSRGERNEQ